MIGVKRVENEIKRAVEWIQPSLKKAPSLQTKKFSALITWPYSFFTSFHLVMRRPKMGED